MMGDKVELLHRLRLERKEFEGGERERAGKGYVASKFLELDTQRRGTSRPSGSVDVAKT